MTGNPLVEKYMDGAVVNKEGILKEIERIQFTFEQRGIHDNERPAAYYHNIRKLLRGLWYQVNSAVLPDPLPTLWSYKVVLDLYGAKLLLMHTKEESLFIDAKDSDEIVVTQEFDAEYVMLQWRTVLFTVEEYAENYGVNVGTVRQWIRRGKIRTAIKEGSEWRIPELTPPPTRGYKTGTYITQELTEVPKALSYIQGCSSITISRDECMKDSYHVLMQKNQDNNDEVVSEERTITEEERGKLEVFLIGSKEVLYIGEL